MLRKIPGTLALAFCLVIAAAANTNADEHAPARWCDIDQGQPAQRILANFDGRHGWKAYRSIKEVPELENDGGELAQLWSGPSGKVLISMQEPGQDFAIYTNYCFGSSGKLLKLNLELRTAWGWGYKEAGSIQRGALKPRLYLRESRFPFFGLLSKN